MTFERHEGVDLDAFVAKLPGAAQIREVDDEGSRHDLTARLTQEVDRGSCGASGRHKVVDQKQPVARLDGIGVNFDRIDPVFEGVFLADDAGRQLAFLRIGTKPRPRTCATAPPRMKPRASTPAT
jgi:hypothetical protein